jgi:hypothetical protein
MTRVTLRPAAELGGSSVGQRPCRDAPRSAPRVLHRQLGPNRGAMRTEQFRSLVRNLPYTSSGVSWLRRPQAPKPSPAKPQPQHRRSHIEAIGAAEQVPAVVDTPSLTSEHGERE